MIELNINKNIKRINQEFGLGLSDLEMIFWQNNPFQINDKSQIKSLLQKKVNDVYEKLID